MDAWVDRVTGFPCLQKADSQAPMPGVPPKPEAMHGRGSGEETSCLQNAQDVPWAGHATVARGWDGQTRSSTARGQVYSHLPHTEPSYPKQNGKEQKQRG